MAVYGTPAGMLAKLGESMLLTIADRDGDGVVDEGIVLTALTSASALIESYISAYLPLPDIMPAIVDAAYVLASESMRVDTSSTTEDSRLGYQRVIDWLTMIAKGTVVLVPPVDPELPPELNPGAPELYAEDREWSRTIARGVL